ncbi:hypothetical protein RND81_03G053500 [Saponaria officinalis]|uniref:Uncharacterized protein n=1 Tax=Saponaria officinalis TaxID=3572 RepID=A0AAW1LYG3_SAPOF
MGRRNEEWQAIGIDLGTSYSCVGIWRNGHVDIIPNDQGSRMTPSCVAFTNTQRLIGEAAVNQGRTNSCNTVFDVKRLIGRRFNDEVVQKDLKRWPFKVIEGRHFGKDDKPLIEVTYMGKEKRFSAEEISAMVLMKMKDIAETYLGDSVTNAVVTVPAYFNDSQRQATKDAGVIAGLNMLRLVNEPTAAAIAYGVDRKMSNYDISRKNVLVFDLGGGTFDVSLVSIENDKFLVKSVNGDTHLGGMDFENRMVDYFVKEFKTKHNKDVSEHPRAIMRLRLACERAKRALSLIPETSIEIDYLCDGIDFNSTISRVCFENLNDDLFKKCISLVEQCLSNAYISKNDVDEIILAGGSTRIPKVQLLLKDFFDGKEIYKSINPDEVVAYGATICAGISCGIIDNKNMVLVDVTPLSLHVELDPAVHTACHPSSVIPRNTIIPLSNKRRKRQSTNDLKVTVYEGERQTLLENNLLGSFEHSAINQPSKYQLDIDINGILSVLAKDSRSGDTSKITIIDPSRLTIQDVEMMTNEAKEYKAQDKKYEERVKAKNKLEDYANNMSERVSNYCGQTIGTKDKNMIENEIQQVLKWLEWNSKEVYDAAQYMKKLDELESKCRFIKDE